MFVDQFGKLGCRITVVGDHRQVLCSLDVPGLECVPNLKRDAVPHTGFVGLGIATEEPIWRAEGVEHGQ